MPQTRSANKKLRRDERASVINLRRKRTLKSLIKQAQESRTVESVRAAISQVDKAVKQNLFHKNRAAHMKSALMKLVNTEATAVKTTVKKKAGAGKSKAKPKTKTPAKSKATKTSKAKK